MNQSIFKSLIPYQLATWQISQAQLEERLAQLQFQPVGSQELTRCGWEPLFPDGSLVYAVQGKWLLTLGIDKRVLPSAAVKTKVNERIRDYEQQRGFAPGRKERKAITEMVTQELLPTALVTHKRLYCWIDVAQGWLGVLASSRSSGEVVLEHLHKCLETLPIQLLNTEQSPCAAMTQWLRAQEAPAPFSIDDACELRAVDDETSVIRYRHHSLTGDEIQQHLQQGKLVHQLALSFADRLSFVLTDRLEIKSLELLDVLQASLKDTHTENAQEQFDAEFTLYVLEVESLLTQLLIALGAGNGPL